MNTCTATPPIGYTQANTKLSNSGEKAYFPTFFQPKSERTIREERWINQAQSGDLEAFNQLILAYQDVVFRQALWMLQEEEAAEDATQEAFLAAYRHINTFRGGSFRAWLLKVTTNHCLDLIRYAKFHTAISMEQYNRDGEEVEPRWTIDNADTPEQALERSEMEEGIIGAIRRLPTAYRTVVILVDLQELPYAEASQVLRVPVGTIKSRLARARHLLRQVL